MKAEILNSPENITNTSNRLEKEVASKQFYFDNCDESLKEEFAWKLECAQYALANFNRMNSVI